MAEHVQQLGLSQESGEANLHDDWTCLAPSINEILKDDHLQAAIESLDTDANAVSLALSDKLENYFEPKNQTNSFQMVSDFVQGDLVLGNENTSMVRRESNTDDDGDTDELNLSYNANSCSQISLDAPKDAQVHMMAVALATSIKQDSRATAFHPKDQEAHLLQMDRTENSPMNSIECDKPQHKYLSEVLSQNSSAVALNTDQVKDTEISHSPARSDDIQQTAEKNTIVTKPNTTEERTQSKTSLKYKPQFGNNKRKLPLSTEKINENTSENQCNVEKPPTDSAECKTSATKLTLASEQTFVKNSLVENGSNAIADETAVAGDNAVSDFSSENINVKSVAAATSCKNNKDCSVTASTSTTGGNELWPVTNKTTKCNNKAVKSKGKPSKCESGTIGNESIQTKIKKSKTNSELTSRKGKNSTKSDRESAKQKAKASKDRQNSSTASNSSKEKEQSSTGIKHFLEQQEKLAHARNLLRSEKQKSESKCTEMSVAIAGLEGTSRDTTENTYEKKLKVWDSEVSVLETLIEQVKSLTEGEEDPEKCFSLLGNIREKVSASLLLKYPVLVAVLEPIQRYEGDEKIKQEAEDIYKKLNSMYIKQNMEDFVFAFDRTLKLHHRQLSKSEQLAKKIMKRILPNSETSTEVTFDIEMWNNLAKERSGVWERFVLEFQELDKTTMNQAASGSSTPTSHVKEEAEETNNDFDSTDCCTRTQEQQETWKLPQPSCNRTNRKTSHSSLMSNPRRAQTIVKCELGVDEDTDVKLDPDEVNANKGGIKEEIVMDTETLKGNSEIQRKQPTRSCKTPKIKEEVLSSDEPFITVKQEFDSNKEIVNTKKEKQQKQRRSSSKLIKKEVLSADEQTVRIKEEIDSDTDILNKNSEFSRIQPGRSCNMGKLELRMHFAKRKRNFNKEQNEKSKKAKVSSG